jgi:hypothetical protein
MRSRQLILASLGEEGAFGIPAIRKFSMIYLLCRHKVADFTKWKRAYDAHLGARQLAGLTELYLLRCIDDPNELVILYTAEDLDKAKGLTTSDEVRAIIQRSGVIGAAEFCFLSQA